MNPHDRSGASQMSDECALRERAREAIQDGRLPAGKPSRTWGGPGSGTRCSVCGEPVMPDQMELEIEYGRNGEAPGLANYRLHVRCFAAWEFASDLLRQPTSVIQQARPRRLAAAPWETD
jgi:hypothetical protein